MTYSTLTTLATVTAMAISAPALAGTVTTDGPDLEINTQGGLSVETTDGEYAFEAGGRIQVDHDTYNDAFNFGNDGDTAGNSEFRRVRIFIEAVVKQYWESKLQIDFEEEDGTIDVEDAYLAYTQFDALSPIVGNFKEPFGLEQLTSSKRISTIERSIVTDFFTPSRRLGAGVYGTFNDNLLYQVGIFRGDINADDDGGDTNDYTGRLVFAPINETGRVIHLGGGYNRRKFAADEFSFNANVRSGDDIDFGFADVNGDGFDTEVKQETFNLEAAGVFGPASLQGEYFNGDLETDDPLANFGGADNFDASGYYVLGTFTVTGQPREYKLGAFRKPGISGPFGAVELVARYDHIEIDESTLDGEVDNLTFGVNWYPNDNLRFSADYVHTQNDGDSVDAITGGEDDGNGIALRAQFVF